MIDEVLHSSDVVKSYSPLIQILEEGDLEERKFAAHARAAIERFNKIVDQASHTPPTWGGRIASFLYEHSGWLIGKKLTKINLPRRAFIQFDFPPIKLAENGAKKFNTKIHFPLSDAASQKVTTVRDAVMPFSQVSRQTIELFYMKVIAMLENSNILSNAEARAVVRSTPIQTVYDKSTQKCTLLQTFIPLPAQISEVWGTFLRDSRTLSFSHPDTDSFHLKTTSMQTGFPHPSQHNGWSLSDILIPECPHRPDQLPLFAGVDESKNNLAQALLPRAGLNEKARIHIKIKKQCFEANKAQHLKLHQQLCYALADAAPKYSLQEDFGSIIDAFFTHLQNHAKPFDYLSETFHTIINYSIVKPYERLQQEWLYPSNPQLHSKDPLERSQAAERFLQEEHNKKMDELNFNKAQSTTELDAFALDFCQLFVNILAHPMQTIVLQHQSEIMGFPPPDLSEFSQKLQACLYYQLIEFQQELKLPISSVELQKKMIETLQQEIAIFKAPALENIVIHPVQIVHELKNYYLSRSGKAQRT